MESAVTLREWFSRKAGKPLVLVFTFLILLQIVFIGALSYVQADFQLKTSQQFGSLLELSMRKNDLATSEALLQLAFTELWASEVRLCEGGKTIYRLPNLLGVSPLDSCELDEDFFGRVIKINLTGGYSHILLMKVARFPHITTLLLFLALTILGALVAMIVFRNLRKGVADDLIDVLVEGCDQVDSNMDYLDKIKIKEIKNVFASYQGKAKEIIKLTKLSLEQDKYRLMAETTSMIAHDLKGHLAIFEKIASDPSQFTNDHSSFRLALNRLYSMTDSIKRADLEGMIRPNQTDGLDLSSLIDSFSPIAEKHRVTLIKSGGSLPSLTLDLAKVERATMNLIVNACEAASKEVSVSWVLEGARLLIEVRDDGPGVPREFEDRLFERGSTFGKTEGTGLGLSFVQHVALGHGGAVTYERDNRQTVFTLILESLQLTESSTSHELPVTENHPIRITDCPEVLVSLLDKDRSYQVASALKNSFSINIYTEPTEFNYFDIVYTDNPDTMLMDFHSETKLILSSLEEPVETIVAKIGGKLP